MKNIAFPFEAASREHSDNTCGTLDALGQTIKEYRKKAGLTQQEMADELNVTRNTVIVWETNRSRPPLEMLMKISHRLSIPVTELFQVRTAEGLSFPEKRLVENYRRLDETGQETASEILRVMAEQAIHAKAKELENDYLPIATMTTPAAAGTGMDYLDASAFEIHFYRKNPRFSSADIVCRVCGHSMEPFYYDGDLVYAELTEDAPSGRDVICDTNDGRIIKRRVGNKLMSLNPDPQYAVHKSGDDNIRIVAEVLGVVPDEDKVEKSAEPELSDIHFEEVGQLKEKFGIE